jgi:hypothetical protein
MWNKVPKKEYINGNGYAPKKNPDKIINKGVIYDPMGQWKYPGQVTKIPSNEITMKGVSYPVLGIDDTGYSQMMLPGMNYTFPGNTVTEYPQLPIAQTGGVLMPGMQGKFLDALNDQFNKQKGGTKYDTSKMWDPKKQYTGSPRSMKEAEEMIADGRIKIKPVNSSDWYKTPDSNAENILEIIDPTGISSWDDVVRSYKDPNSSKYNTAIEILGALPLLGKAGKILKSSAYLGKGLNGYQYNKMLLNASNIIDKLGKAGRVTDAYQAGEQMIKKQFGGDPSIPDLNQMRKGGWLEGYSKQTKLRGNRGYTSKNIKTSINKLMLRNETLFGPRGRRIYDPTSKFQDGGWLDTYQTAGQTTAKNYYATSPEDYTKRKQMYADSLAIAKPGQDFLKAVKSKEINGMIPDALWTPISDEYGKVDISKPYARLTAANKKEPVGKYNEIHARSSIDPTGIYTGSYGITTYKNPTQKVHPYQPPVPVVNNTPKEEIPVKENKWGNLPYETKSHSLPTVKGDFGMNKLGQKYYIDDKGKKTWLTESEYEQRRVPKKALGGWLNKYS